MGITMAITTIGAGAIITGTAITTGAGDITGITITTGITVIGDVDGRRCIRNWS
jgi:hypothetical protein